MAFLKLGRFDVTRLVKIERKKLDPNAGYGVIVSQSPALTLVHWEYDFQFDGFWVARTKDITLCESSDANDYNQVLMRQEGLWEPVPRSVKRLPVGSWAELIGALVGKVVILQDEVKEDFWIGPLVEARARYALVHYFDPCGRLKGVEKVLYSRITVLKFGDRYSKIHGKYLRTGEEGAKDVLNKRKGR